MPTTSDRKAAPQTAPKATASPRKIPTMLTQKVRALYEDSVVPVAEIARLAGVSERTLYKHAQRGGWKTRYARRPLLKGTGGRFVSAAQASRSQVCGQVCGLGALDPARAAKAAADCERAGRASARAVRRALAAERLLDEFAIRVRSLGLLTQALKALAVSPRRGGAL